MSSGKVANRADIPDLMPHCRSQRAEAKEHASTAPDRQLYFLETVVPFPAVQTGNYGDVLLRVVDELCAELGAAEPEEIPGARSSLGEEGVMAGILSSEDEQAVTGLRRGLATIAAALSGQADAPDTCAVQAALDGAELVMRGELVNGNGSGLPRLLPSFVFLVALPIVDQDRALALSRRATELIERELRQAR